VWPGLSREEAENLLALRRRQDCEVKAMNWSQPLTRREYLLWVLAVLLLTIGGSLFIAALWLFRDVIRLVLAPGFVQMMLLVLAVPASVGLILLLTLLFSSPTSSESEPEAAEYERVSVREVRRFEASHPAAIEVGRPAGYIEQPRY
jgi:hypothetical protein